MKGVVPGTQWTDGVRRGTVVRVDRAGVRLMTDEGVVDVAAYAWPGEWALLSTDDEVDRAEDAAGERRYRAILIGGAAGKHFERILDLASEQGVDIEFHVPGDKIGNKLPPTVELVIFLVSHMGHRHQDAIKSVAKERNIPIVMVRSDGFSAGLEAEMQRIGLDTKRRFGGMGPEQATSSGWYTWTGEVWEWTEREPEADGGDGLLAFGLLGLALYGATRR